MEAMLKKFTQGRKGVTLATAGCVHVREFLMEGQVSFALNFDRKTSLFVLD